MDFANLKERALTKFVYLFKLDKYVNSTAETGIAKILSYEYGHTKSKVKQQSLNATGEPLPWFTYPAIEYLLQLNLKDKIILEWGAGNSSLFFSKRVKSVCSIEHNKNWYEEILSLNIPNQKILFKEESIYAEAIKEFNQKFDIIIIDGILRRQCAITSLEFLNNGGIIILDNSDRDPEIAEYLRANNLIEVDMHGFGPINDYTWTTSFFFMRNFNFEPLGKQPTIPIGGGY